MSLELENLTALVDSRERQGWDLSPMKTEVVGLATADYSIKGLSDMVAVERKNLSDFVQCCGSERKRFEAELLRLKGYPHRLLIIEATWLDLRAGNWRGRVTADTVSHSVLSWTSKYNISILLAGDRLEAQEACKFFLLSTARRWAARAGIFKKAIDDES